MDVVDCYGCYDNGWEEVFCKYVIIVNEEIVNFVVKLFVWSFGVDEGVEVVECIICYYKWYCWLEWWGNCFSIFDYVGVLRCVCGCGKVFGE